MVAPFFYTQPLYHQGLVLMCSDSYSEFESLLPPCVFYTEPL
jgi:hypothetical protein